MRDTVLAAAVILFILSMSVLGYLISIILNGH